MEALRLTRQIRACWKWAVLVLVVAGLVLAAAFFVQFKEGVAMGDLTRDPTSVAEVPLYIGFVSQFGIFLWSATATCCLMAGLALARQGQDRQGRNFFLYAAGLSLMLGMDDLFLLHEVFFPYFGVPELVVFGVYGVLVAVFLGLFLRLLLRSEYLLLLMAFGFLGLSVLTDLADVVLIEPFLLEDGLKLVGILAWLCYFARTSLLAIAPLPRRQEAARAPMPLQPAGPRERPLFVRGAGGKPLDAAGKTFIAKG